MKKLNENTLELGRDVQKESRARIKHRAFLDRKPVSPGDVLIANFGLDEALAMAEAALRSRRATGSKKDDAGGAELEGQT